MHAIMKTRSAPDMPGCSNRTAKTNESDISNEITWILSPPLQASTRLRHAPVPLVSRRTCRPSRQFWNHHLRCPR
jgi:hypothetical protein